jgi:hypothetical protein
MLTHGAMPGCGCSSLVVCINDKFHDIRERNVTIRSEIWTTNIRSLGFRNIRECVTLWRLTLWSLGCIRYVGVFGSILHVLQLHPSMFTQRNLCCCIISKSTMKYLSKNRIENQTSPYLVMAIISAFLLIPPVWRSLSNLDIHSNLF